MIRTLQALRGIFAIMIFLVHYPLAGPPTFVPGGDCGVAFFMMLSGFVMSAGYEQRLLHSDVGSLPFALRRMAKVYPLHLLFFILALILYTYNFNRRIILEAIANISLLQSWVPKATFSFNAVSWFLSDVLFFYLVFPTIVRHKLNYRRPAVIAFFVCVIIYLCAIKFLSDDTAEYFCYVFPPVRLIDFFRGMLLWRLYSTLRRKGVCERFGNLNLASRSAVELAAIALLTVTILLFSHTPVCYQVAAIWWPTMAVTILVFSISDCHRGVIGRLLKTRPLQIFGAASFVFFLFHRLGMAIVLRILGNLSLDIPDIPLLIINFMAITAGAMLIHRYFQQSWNKRLHR